MILRHVTLFIIVSFSLSYLLAEIAEEGQNIPRSLDQLPQLHQRGVAYISSGKKIPVQLKLKKACVINSDAPSWLRFYQVHTDRTSLICSFNKDEIIKGGLVLPPLEKAKLYLIQGTFYYCVRDKKAICFLESISQEINTNHNKDTIDEYIIRIGEKNIKSDLSQS